MIVRCVVCAGIIFFLLAAGARAEAVLVRHGSSIGNGWLFVDRDGRCRLAVPAHVVQPGFPSGPLADVLITDRKGRTLEAGNGSVPAPEMDLAFLQVRPFDQEFLCTRSRLGKAGLAVEIEAMREGDIEIMGEGGLQRETVERIAQSRSDLASTITIRPRNAGFTLVEGYSGSIILAGGTPIAMVTNVVGEANVAIALRFDAIDANLSEPVASPLVENGDILEIFAVAGTTPDPDRPPSASVGQAGWTAAPENGRIALEFIAGDGDLTGLSFDAEGAPDGNAFIEHRSRTGSDYAYVVPCPVRAGHAACRFGSRKLDIVRLTIRASKTVTVRNLAIIR